MYSFKDKFSMGPGHTGIFDTKNSPNLDPYSSGKENQMEVAIN